MSTDGRLDYCVVIPAHQAERWVADAVRSALTQSLPPADVVVVDDGSSDDTAGAATAAGARVIRLGTARGPGAARNVGLAATAAPYVAFLDADDLWRVNHIAGLWRALREARAILAFSALECFGASSRVEIAALSARTPLDFRDVLWIENPIPQSAVIVRRDAIAEAGGYDESLAVSEDYECWLRLAGLGPFAYVAEPTMLRRVHDRQLSSSASLVVSSWRVRARHLGRLLAHEGAQAYVRAEPLLVQAARADLGRAIWSGRRAALNELVEAVEEFEVSVKTAGLRRAAGLQPTWRMALIHARQLVRRTVLGVR